MGCGLVVLLALAYSGCALITWLVISAQNAINSPDAVRLPPIIILAGLVLGGASIFVIGRTLRRAHATD
jgi:hypothetical protein